MVRAQGGEPNRVLITGSDPRGVMFGVGKLLRVLDWKKGNVTLPADFAADLSPDRPIRGHQVGYRATANSWDAWTTRQFDQYFRDLVIFGANSIENIPFEGKVSDVMKYGRREMNLKLSEMCAKYDIDHWEWVPVEFLLPNPQKEAKFLAQQEQFYKACPRLDAVFVPGGDPGDNLFKDLLPYVEKMAAVLRKYHPKATVWISLQRPHRGDAEAFFDFLDSKHPAWFGGAVMGPSGPSMELYRRRLPKEYKLRWYPDITHTVRCQYPVPWLDPAWGVTLGAEPVNPRPVDFAAIYRNDYRLTDGFISYSDGIHDDFNKNLFTQLAWEPDRPVREIAVEYARFFFRPDLAQVGADAILCSRTIFTEAWLRMGWWTAPCGNGSKWNAALTGTAHELAFRHASLSRRITTPTRGTGRFTKPASNAGARETGRSRADWRRRGPRTGARNSGTHHHRALAPGITQTHRESGRHAVSGNRISDERAEVSRQRTGAGLRDGFRQLPAQ